MDSFEHCLREWSQGDLLSMESIYAAGGEYTKARRCAETRLARFPLPEAPKKRKQSRRVDMPADVIERRVLRFGGLSSEQVREIRESKEISAVVAKRYGISRDHAQDIRQGRSYAWV